MKLPEQKQNHYFSELLAVVFVLVFACAGVYFIFAGHAESGVSYWDKPALVNPTTVAISESNRNLLLDQTKDYILTCPNYIVQATWELSVWGGHNVVFENCDYENSAASGAFYPHNQTGTMWVHDVHFGGPELSEGIDIQEPGKVAVVLRDVLIDTVHGSYTTNHADLIQTWSGPQRLLVDGLTGTTDYQGFFLLPNQQDPTTTETVYDFRNIDIDDSNGATALWVGDTTPFPVNVENVYVVPNSAANRTWRGWWLYGFNGNNPEAATPCTGTWCAVQAGTPPGGHFVSPSANGASGSDEGVSPTPRTDELLSGTNPKVGDLNGDGAINVFDLSIFLSHWQQSGSGLPEDLNGDNAVNIFDLSILLNNYGA